MTLEQKKLIACAELAGLKHKACNCGCGREYWVAEYGSSFQICLFATSLDAIVPVVIKWCNEHGWSLFTSKLIEITGYRAHQLSESSSYAVQMTIRATPSQILDGLLLAAGKMPKGGG